MPWFNNTAYLKMIDSMAIIIAQAYQLARSRLASASSPVIAEENQKALAQIESSQRRCTLSYTDTLNTEPYLAHEHHDFPCALDYIFGSRHS